MSVCPAAPRYHEKELSMRPCSWQLVFLKDFQTPLPPFHIYSNSISIILLHVFTQHPCLHSSICQEISPVCSQFIPLWSHFPPNEIYWDQYCVTHLVCTLWLFSPSSPPLSHTPPPSHSSSLPPFLPSSSLLRSLFLLLLGWCYRPTTTAYTLRACNLPFVIFPKFAIISL